MRKRTLSREIALKVLYASDVTRETVQESWQKYWESNDPEEESVKSFAEFLVSGVDANRAKVDETISKYAANWTMERMATIDRNILRIATFELLQAEETPPKVAINEAIDMAKKYGDKDSGKFVNGILDKINKTDNNGLSCPSGN